MLFCCFGAFKCPGKDYELQLNCSADQGYSSELSMGPVSSFPSH